MIRHFCILGLIFGLLWAGVDYGYGWLKQQLVTGPAPKVRTEETLSKGQEQQPSGANGPAAQRKPHPQASVAASKKGDAYQIIVQRNIFGAVLDQKTVVEEEPKKEEPEAEKTTLKLTLLGTISGDERDARAIIVDEKSKRQDIYQIGDAVQDALITEIKRGKVILDVDGKRQFLVIKDRKESGVGEPAMPLGQNEGVSTPSPPVRSAPKVVPHRRVNFRQQKNKARRSLNRDDLDNPEEQEQDMEDMGRDADVVD